MLKKLEGYKTYIGLFVGAIGVICPAVGVPTAACNAVTVIGGIIALYGKYDADNRLSAAILNGKNLAEDIKSAIKK